MPCRLADTADGSQRRSATLQPAELHPRGLASLQASPPRGCGEGRVGSAGASLLGPPLPPPESRAGAQYCYPELALELETICGLCDGPLDPVDRGSGVCGACEYGLAP
jgi:hypothetical protein